jgi:hypothetical protein
MTSSSHFNPNMVPAPCIIDRGIVANKSDICRLLGDLTRVRYLHLQDGQAISEGEGCVLEVFVDPQRSTLVANHTLYLNVCSFDYLELHQMSGQMNGQESYFDLVQEQRRLRLIPLSNPLIESGSRSLNAAALEAMMAEVLSASLDAQMDDEDLPSF